MKIIDAHVNLMNSPIFDEEAKNSGGVNDPEILSENYAANDVESVVVMGTGDWGLNGKRKYGCPMIPGLKYREILEKKGIRVSYCLGVKSSELLNMEYSQQKVCWDMFEREIQNRQCAGVKLYPGYESVYAYDTIHRPIFELLAKYNLPAVVHTGDIRRGKGILKYAHPLTVDELAADFPRVKFVISHCGSPWICDAVEVAVKNPNVSIDLSGLAKGNFTTDWFLNKYEDFVSYFKMWMTYLGDYNKLIFGTDWPVVSIESYIALIKKLVPDAAYDDVFYNNALRVFNLI